jgi:DNA-directed RNA polymerase specialized sigma24 family protein
MTSAADVFIVQLGRASSRALRFLHAKELERDDRDDVIASALVWCWENRESYPLTATIEQWFFSAVQHAYRDWERGEMINRSAALANIPTEDTTEASAEAISAADALIEAMAVDYRRVIWLEMHGYTRREMMEKGIPHDTIYEARQRIQQLRKLVPDCSIASRIYLNVTPAAGSSDDPSEENDSDIEVPAPNSDALGSWASQQTTRVIGGVGLFGPLETYASKVRKLLNKRAGLEESFMPTYVPPKHWRS